MSSLVQIDFSPTHQTLRQFGWIGLVGFSFLAMLAWFEWLVFMAGLGSWREPVVVGLLGVGLYCGVMGVVFPRANWPVFVGLSLVAFPIGFVLSHLILGLLFFGMLTPVGLFFRLTGRDALNRRFEPEATSYWSDPRPDRGKESYFRQF